MAPRLRTTIAPAIACALSAFIAGAASAADLGEDMMMVDHSIHGTDWTGAYLGAAAGWGSGTSEADITPGNSVSIDADGSVVSIYAGYNFQMGRIVVGIEGDYSWANSDGSRSCVLAPTVTGTCSAALDSTAGVRGRIGWAFDTLHVYGTLGMGWADVRARVQAATPIGAIDVEASETVPAFVYGAGAEWKMWERLSLRGEVMHSTFNSQDFEFTGLGSTKAEVEATAVRAGLTWHVN